MRITITKDQIYIDANDPKIIDLNYLIELFTAFKNKWEMDAIGETKDG